MPTDAEQATLLDADKVNATWITLNGVTGYSFTDKTSAATIFLPAAGGRSPDDGTLYDVGGVGIYWSGSYMYSLAFSNSIAHQGNSILSSGFPVRCVRQ